MALASHRLFYPAAALHAAIALPVTAFLFPGAHPREMLFGFALAVVAGNQLGAVPPPRLRVLFALWLAGRAALFAPQPLAASAANAAFALLLALEAAPRLLGAAKKLRNRALPIALLALCAAAAAAAFGRFVPELAVMLFALLMLFMGGRIVAPAVAGQLGAQGEPLQARVQPRIEGAALACAFLAAAATLVPEARLLAAAASAAAGVLAAVRLARWRLWALRRRPDLLCLAAGYAWLALGLVTLGAALAAGRHLDAAVHVITVGAIGTLTFNVMSLSWLLKARRHPSRAAQIVPGTLLLGAATVLRVLGAFAAGPWLAAAAACWSAAFALLLVLFARSRGAA